MTKLLLDTKKCNSIFRLLKNRKQNKRILLKEKTIKTILIDGSNVIRKSMYNVNNNRPDYELEDNYLFPKLYKKIVNRLIFNFDRIVFFLDGERRFLNIDKSQDVQIEFSGTKEADELIINDIITIKNMQPNIDKNIVLVSEDKNLIKKCKEEYNDLNIIRNYDLIKELGIHKRFYSKKFFNKEQYNVKYTY